MQSSSPKLDSQKIIMIKKAFLIIILLLIVSMIFSIGYKKKEEINVYSSDASELIICDDGLIVIELSPDSLTPSGGSFNIHNESSVYATYGSDAYVIEVLTCDVWCVVEPLSNSLIHLLACTILPFGDSQESVNWEYRYGPLPKGKYRLIYDFCFDGEGKQTAQFYYYYSCEFDIN